MLSHFRRLYRNERGFSFVFIGLSFVAFLSATTLAIDVGMFMTARSQAQNSADAGALAGATALVFDSFTDHSATGPAVTSAVSAASKNTVVGDNVSVGSGDVQFLADPVTGQIDRVQVTVYRTAARSNPVPTLMGQFFGISQVDITATATAEAAPANAATCVLPFMVPDKWIEKSDGTGTADGPWDPNKTFDLWYTKGSNQNGGVPLPTPDVYTPPATDGTPGTGFSLPGDVGTEMVLKSNNQNKISPSIYNPIDLGTSTGANDYKANIIGCNQTLIKPGDFLTPETGNMTGPTKQGVDALVAKDPDAAWDSSCNCVMRDGVKVTSSPRIGLIPIYDPNVYANGQQSGKSQPQLQVVNMLGFFVENANSSGDITGRIVPTVALKTGSGTATSFVKVIRLVQ